MIQNITSNEQKFGEKTKRCVAEMYVFCFLASLSPSDLSWDPQVRIFNNLQRLSSNRLLIFQYNIQVFTPLCCRHKLSFYGETVLCLTGGQTLRPEGGADWLTAVECFYGVGLVGGSTLPYFVPLIKGHDIGGTGMSPLCVCFSGSRKSLGTCESGDGTRSPLTLLRAC